MKKLKPVCIFLMCIAYCNIYSQRDSLRQVYRNTKLVDSTRFTALEKLYTIYLYKEPKIILEDITYHRELAKEKNNKLEFFYAVFRKATILMMLNENDKALSQFNDALVLANDLKREDLIARLKGNRASLYRAKLMYPEAIRDLNEALAIYSDLKMDIEVSWIKQTLAFFQIDIGSYDEALKNLKGIEYDTIYSDLIFKKTIIANNKLVIGKVYLKKEAYKDAQIYFESALKLFKEQDLSSKIAQCYRYLSQIHNKLKETDKAINYATFALELSKQNKDERSITIGLLYLAEASFKKDIPTSIKLSSDILSRNINNEDYEFKSRLYGLLYKCYRSQKNSKLAFQMLELSSAYQDSLDIKTKNLATFRELVKQDYEEQLFQSKKFSKRRILNGSVLAIFFIFCVILYFKKKIKKNIIAKSALLDEIERIKSTTSINQFNLVSAKFKLDIEKIEQHIDKKLNNTDRKVLFVLLQDPVISNKEIAEKVSLSIEGVGSSLRRMYVYFNTKESKYKKISLLLDAVKLSNN